MNMHKTFPAWCRCLAATSFVIACWPLTAAAQTTRPAAERRAEAPGRRVGVVTGDRVNVRSGSDQNYYPVTQLNMGDQVFAVGDQHGWLEILPPKGTYSLIEKTYVTVGADTDRGTVNEGVWVKAGSEMSTRRYAKQVKLDRGAKVEILGETEDGDFYKITPPQGATLWISGDFVDLNGGTAIAGSPTSNQLKPVEPGQLLGPREATPSDTATTREAATTVTRRSDGGTRTETIERTRTQTPAPSAFQSEHQIEIKALEAEITAESTKPLQDQDYDAIIERLMGLAEVDDEVTQRYAQTRLKQIRTHIDLIETLNRVEELTSSAIAEANERQRERASIHAAEAISLDNIVVQGVIEVSSIYRGSDARPRRWRIVEHPDPSDKVRDAEVLAPKTLAYLEVPEGSNVDPMEYIGQRVGIRASKRRYIRDAIPPIPIYTVAEIIVMNSPNRRTSPATRPAGSGASEPDELRRSNRAVVASPDSARVAAPRSQPAGAMKPVATEQPVSK